MCVSVYPQVHSVNTTEDHPAATVWLWVHWNSIHSLALRPLRGHPVRRVGILVFEKCPKQNPLYHNKKYRKQNLTAQGERGQPYMMVSH